MKSKWLKLSDKIITLLLLLLGFSACEGSEEYGMPHVHYTLKGKVVNHEKKSISNIQMIIKAENQHHYGDTLYTDKDGEFEYDNPGAWPSDKLNVIYRDLRNQDIVYKTDSTLVDMGKATGGSGSWNHGQAYKEITIQLEEKKQEEQH